MNWSRVSLITLWMASSLTSAAKADTEASIAEGNESSWPSIRKRIRARSFTEFMTPGIQSNNNAIPDENGTPLDTTNFFSIFWTDYEFASNYRLVYWQRFKFFPIPAGSNQGIDLTFRNPRFALRRTQVFDNPNLNTTYDLYIQPGFASESVSAGRTFEYGFRTNTNYSFPGSRFSVGLLTEFTLSHSNKNGPSPDYYGWFTPWMNYDLSKTFSTQHYFNVNFFHKRGDRMTQLQYDTPMPYIQNGIGANLSTTFFTAVFLNNYVNTAPSWNNTWASLWLAMNLL